MGIQWRIRYRLSYEFIVIPNFKSHDIIISARVYFMKRVKDCKDVSIMSPKMNSEFGQVYSVCILHFLVLLSTTVCSQNINKPYENRAHNLRQGIVIKTSSKTRVLWTGVGSFVKINIFVMKYYIIQFVYIVHFFRIS